MGLTRQLFAIALSASVVGALAVTVSLDDVGSISSMVNGIGGAVPTPAGD